MTVRELVIPFQRNKRSKSVTTAGRPAGQPLILTFLRYIEVDSLRASRSARNQRLALYFRSIRSKFWPKTDNFKVSTARNLKAPILTFDLTLT